MMKNFLPLPFRNNMSILLILVVLFLSACSDRVVESQKASTGTEQNSTTSARKPSNMSQKEWDNLVEYVACYYAWAYYDHLEAAYLLQESKPTSIHRHQNIETLHTNINNCRGSNAHKNNCNSLVDIINAKKESEDRTLDNLIQLPDIKPEDVNITQKYTQWMEMYTNQLREDTILIQCFSAKIFQQKNLCKSAASNGKKKEDMTAEIADAEKEIKKDKKRRGNTSWWLFMMLGAAAGLGGVMAWRKWVTPFFSPEQEKAPKKRKEPSLQHDEYKKMQLQLEKYKENNLQLESKNRRLEEEKRELVQKNKSLFQKNIVLGDELDTLKAQNEHAVFEEFPENTHPINHSQLVTLYLN